MIERHTEKKKPSKGRSPNPDKYPTICLACLIIILVGLVFFVLVVPIFIAHRQVSYCHKAESDAKVIAAHIVEYLSVNSQTAIPTLKQLRNWKNLALSGKNKVTITGTNPNEPIIITVTDGSGKMPGRLSECYAKLGR